MTVTKNININDGFEKKLISSKHNSDLSIRKIKTLTVNKKKKCY